MNLKRRQIAARIAIQNGRIVGSAIPKRDLGLRAVCHVRVGDNHVSSTRPLMLFSGTFFPLSQLPAWLRLLAYATPLWHGVNLCRMLSLGHLDLPMALVSVAYLIVLAGGGIWAGARTYRRRLYV